MALVHEQLDALYVQQRLSCDLGFHAVCVMPAIAMNLSAKVWELNRYLSGPRNVTFLNYTLQLAHAIAKINVTRVDPISAQSPWDGLVKAAG